MHILIYEKPNSLSKTYVKMKGAGIPIEALNLKIWSPSFKKLSLQYYRLQCSWNCVLEIALGINLVLLFQPSEPS